MDIWQVTALTVDGEWKIETPKETNLPVHRDCYDVQVCRATTEDAISQSWNTSERLLNTAMSKQDLKVEGISHI